MSNFGPRTKVAHIPDGLVVFPSVFFVCTLIVRSIGVIHRSSLLLLRIEVYIRGEYRPYKRVLSQQTCRRTILQIPESIRMRSCFPCHILT